jgi:serine/threonine protein kinase
VQPNLQHLLCLSSTDGIVLGEPMGSGRYGTVFEASLKGSQWPASLLGRDLVVKVLKSETVDEVGSKRRRDCIFDEFIFGSLRHPSLVGCLAFTQLPPFWALFERCNRGSLWDALKGRSWGGEPLLRTVRQHGVSLAIQFLDGVNHLHERGMVHCDLHKNNVLLHEEAGRLSIKIADFGLCGTLSDGSSHRVVRHKDREHYRDRHPHVAPELVARQPYSAASDILIYGQLDTYFRK